MKNELPLKNICLKEKLSLSNSLFCLVQCNTFICTLTRCLKCIMIFYTCLALLLRLNPLKPYNCQRRLMKIKIQETYKPLLIFIDQTFFTFYAHRSRAKFIVNVIQAIMTPFFCHFDDLSFFLIFSRLFTSHVLCLSVQSLVLL